MPILYHMPQATVRPLTIAVMLLVPILLAGCRAGFTSTPYYDLDPTQPQKGILYKLPRTLIDYTVHYAVYKIVPAEGAGEARHAVWLDVPITDSESSLPIPISMSTSVAGDGRATFVINTEDLAAFSVLTEESKLSLNSEGVLLSANATFHDKSLEIFKQSLSTFIRLAKVAVNPSGKGRGFTGAQTVTKVGRATASGQIDYALLDNSTPIDCTMSYTIPHGAALKQLQLTSGIQSLSVPQIRATFTPEARYRRLDAAQAAAAIYNHKALRKAGNHHGIWVRHPGSVSVAVHIDGVRVYSDRKTIADAGPTTLIPLKSRFATKRTQSMTFHEGGGVKDFDFSTTSQGETITKTTDEAAESIATAIPEFLKEREAGNAPAREAGRQFDIEREKIDRSGRAMEEIDNKIAAKYPAFQKLQDEVIPGETDAQKEARSERQKELDREIKELQNEKDKEERVLNEAKDRYNRLLETLKP